MSWLCMMGCHLACSRLGVRHQALLLPTSAWAAGKHAPRWLSRGFLKMVSDKQGLRVSKPCMMARLFACSCHRVCHQTLLSIAVLSF